VFRQLVSEIGTDADRVEHLPPVGKRLLQRALDGLGADQDFGDFVICEQLLELTVRDGLDLGEARPEVLDQHHAEKGRKDVPGGELLLALLGLLGRRLRVRLRRLVAVVAEAEKLQEAPTGRRFHVLGRLVGGEVAGINWSVMSVPFGASVCSRSACRPSW
jgi:hypothetical protein